MIQPEITIGMLLLCHGTLLREQAMRKVHTLMVSGSICQSLEDAGWSGFIATRYTH